MLLKNPANRSNIERVLEEKWIGMFASSNITTKREMTKLGICDDTFMCYSLTNMKKIKDKSFKGKDEKKDKDIKSLFLKTKISKELN